MENNFKYIVYCTTCKQNGKIYIGVHKTENPEIFDGYLGNGIYIGYKLKHPETAFQYAVKKYGYSSFVRNILYIYDTQEEAYNKEAEIVNLDFVKRRDNYNTAIGGVYSDLVYDSLYQYDLNGNFIKEFKSIQEAVEYFKCNKNRFNIAIKNKYSAFNSYWSKIYVDHLDISEYKTSKHSELYQYDLDGNLIKIFNSNIEAIQELNITSSSLSDARSHRRPLKGFYFLSEDINIYDIIKTRELVYNITDRSVSKYSNNKLICTYPNIANAAKQNKISQTQIKNAIKNNTGEWSYGFNEYYTNYTKPKPVKIAQYDLNGNLIKVWDSISQCQKRFPKFKNVMIGERSHTHGFTFKYYEVKDIV